MRREGSPDPTEPVTETLCRRPAHRHGGRRGAGCRRRPIAGDDQFAAAVLDALGRHGVLVFRDLHLEPEAQVEFCRKLGEIDYAAADDPIPGVMRVTLDRSKNASAPYLKGTFFWHIDGCTPAGDECPQMATVLSAKAVAETGGETEFASTYAAYDDLIRRREGAVHRRSRRPLARSLATPGLP